MIQAWLALVVLCALHPGVPRHAAPGRRVITTSAAPHAAPAAPHALDAAPPPIAGFHHFGDYQAPAVHRARPRPAPLWLAQHRLLC